MEFIKKYIFTKSLQKLNAQSPTQKSFVTYNQATSILLLFKSDDEEQNVWVKKIIQELSSDGKKIVAWGFVNKKVITSFEKPNFTIYNKKAFNWFGKPTATLEEHVSSYDFDLLIDLSSNRVCGLLYLGMLANARFKIGAKHHDFQLYDFTIDLELFVDSLIKKIYEEEDENESKSDILRNEQMKYLYEQIIFYLKKIETKD